MEYSRITPRLRPLDAPSEPRPAPPPLTPIGPTQGSNQQIPGPSTQAPPPGRPPPRPAPRHAPALGRRRNVAPVRRTSAATSAAARAARGRAFSRARSCRALGPAGRGGSRPARVQRTGQHPPEPRRTPTLPDVQRPRMPLKIFGAPRPLPR